MADIDVVLLLDDAKYLTSLDNAQKKADSFSKTVDDGLNKNETSFKKASEAAGKHSEATDQVAHSTVGARREMMVLAHELSQGNFTKLGGSMMVLAEQTGGFGNALTMVGSMLMGPIGAMALLTIGVIATVEAYNKFKEQSSAVDEALASTGHYAGQTEESMRSLAETIAGSSKLSSSAALEMETAIAKSGKISSEAFFNVTRAASEYARVNGVGADEAAKWAVKTFSDPAKGARELSDITHSLTAAEIEQIDVMQRQGHTAEAASVLADKYAQSMHKVSTETGFFSGMAKQASEDWAAFSKAVFGAANNEGPAKIKSLSEEIATIQERMNKYGTTKGGLERVKELQIELNFEAARLKMADELAKKDEQRSKNNATDVHALDTRRAANTLLQQEVVIREKINELTAWQNNPSMSHSKDADAANLDAIKKYKEDLNKLLHPAAATKSASSSELKLLAEQDKIDLQTLLDQRAIDKVKLQQSSVGDTADIKANKIAGFDAETNKMKEILRLNSEISRVKIESAALPATDTGAIAINQQIVALLEKQKVLVTEKVSALGEELQKLKQIENQDKIDSMYGEQKLSVEKDLLNFKLQSDALTMTSQQKSLQAIKQKVNDEAAAIIKVRESQIGADKMSAEEKRKIHEQTAATYASEFAAQEQLNSKSREFSTGWTQAWNQFNDDANNSAMQAKQMFNAMSSSFDSMFQQMMTNGKVNWKQLLDNMVMQMMMSDVHKLFANLTSPSNSTSASPSANGGSGSGGGFWSGVGKMFSGGFATGGTIPAGGYGVVGENGPEYVNGPASITPMTKGNATQVHYNISAVDAKSFQQMIAADPQFLWSVTQQGQRSMGV